MNSPTTAIADDYALLLRFLNAAPVGLVQIDPGGRIELINAVSSALLMPIAERGELINLFDTLRPIAPELAELAAAFSRSSGTVVDARRLEISAASDAAPSSRFVSFSLMKLDPHRLMAVFLDVTPQVREENALRESEAVRLHAEARFRAVIENSPRPYALVDEAGRLTFMNRAFIDLFGYTLEDIPTRDFWWQRAYPNLASRRWVQETWQTRLAEAARSGNPFEPMEFFIRCKDGSQRTAISNVADLDGAYHGTHLAIMIDVTEQRLLEASVLEDSERERNRLGRDLHDGLGQELTGLALLIKALSHRIPSATREQMAADLNEIRKIAESALLAVRNIAHGLSPLQPGVAGFLAAIERLAASTRASSGLGVAVTVLGFADAPHPDQAACFGSRRRP